MSSPAPAALEPLAKFEFYGSQARKAALDHFEKSSIDEIESILGKSSPDEGLRDDLAWTLWKYARGKAGQDGSVPELPSHVRHYIELLDKTARPLRDALVKLEDAYICNEAEAHTVAIMLTAAGIDAPGVLGELETILSVAGNADKSEGGRPADVEYGILMSRVIDIFQLATGRQPTLTWDPFERTFAGKFFRIAELVGEAAAKATQGQARSNSALGSLLKRLLKVRIPA
jgi:hypothetical protein